ncbi:MAG: ABC transporter substrate-binding protein [Streptococcaceae bacterium]|jgi:iron complex transport system substrate-binding protein|nr:ABC transporter substrate-binding protein [Streptococcaceae bacterium]
MKKFKLLIIGLISIIALAGCAGNDKKESATKDTQSEATSYPLTIENYAKADGATKWTKKSETYDAAPKSVLANTRPMAELLLHLGLGKSISGVGAVFGEADTSVSDEFAKLNQLSTTYIPKETALSVSPDFIFGRGDLFENSEWGVGTVDSLNEMGINTYVMKSSIKGGTFNSLYGDIENLGQIFDAQDKAAQFESELKARQKKVEDALKGIKKEKTFAYIHSNDPDDIAAYSLTDDTFSLSIFKMLKLKHVFSEPTGMLSLETLIVANPDVLIIPKWDGYNEKESGAEKMLEGVLKSSKVSNMKAFKNKQVYIVDYNYLFGYSYQSLDGVEKLAKEMYPDLVK